MKINIDDYRNYGKSHIWFPHNLKVADTLRVPYEN
jgi:hypothetical protein